MYIQFIQLLFVYVNKGSDPVIIRLNPDNPAPFNVHLHFAHAASEVVTDGVDDLFFTADFVFHHQLRFSIRRGPNPAKAAPAKGRTNETAS